MTVIKLNRHALSRRTLLRGMVGGSLVSVGLPALEAMLNDNGTALADGTDLPCRFVSFFWADGVLLDRFEPQQVGADWQLSEEMAPLANVKEYINVLTGLQNPSTVGKTHHEGMTVFNGYNYIDKGSLDSDAGGPTLDQLIADVVSEPTPVRAVHTQISKRISTDGDGGTTAIAMSHRGEPGNLIANTPQVNPKLVWQTLFGAFAEPVDTRPPRLKVIDAVREDAARLRSTLGTEDQKRLDAHLQGIDELQTKIEAQTPSCALPSEPTEENVDVGGEEPITAVTQAMADLIAYAFVCDITRVATVMFKRFVSSTIFDEVNATNEHHSSSHQLGSGWENNYNSGIVYQVEKLAQLLETFRNTADGPTGNLLDSTIVYASTDVSTGWAHSIARQPIILAGHGRGYLKNPGVHYQATPWNNNFENPNAAGTTSAALLTCLKAFDPSADSIGGGPGQTSSVISEVIA